MSGSTAPRSYVAGRSGGSNPIPSPSLPGRGRHRAAHPGHEAHRTLPAAVAPRSSTADGRQRPALDPHRGGGRCRRSDVPGTQGFPLRRRLDERADGSAGTTLPLTITKEQVTYWASPHLPDFAPERFPVWIWMDVPSFYGFPAFGEPGPKGAQDVGGRPTTPATRDFAPDPDASPASTPYDCAPAIRTRARAVHEDLPLHDDAGSGLRHRRPCPDIRTSISPSGPPTASSSPRSSSGASSASWRRTARPARTWRRSVDSTMSCACPIRRRASWSEPRPAARAAWLAPPDRGDSRHPGIATCASRADRATILTDLAGDPPPRDGDTGGRHRPGGAGRDMSGLTVSHGPAAVRGGTMLTSARARAMRRIMILAASAAILLPSALPVSAAEPVACGSGRRRT